MKEKLNSIDKIAENFLKYVLEVLLASCLLLLVYIISALYKSPYEMRYMLEVAKITIDYTSVSLMLCVGCGLFMDYVFKKEKFSE